MGEDSTSPEPTQAEVDTRGALASLVGAMTEQLDSDGVEAGNEPKAYQDAVRLLQLPPRSGFRPQFVSDEGSYYLVAAFAISFGDQGERLRKRRLSPIEDLARELVEGIENVPAVFEIAEPSAEAARALTELGLKQGAEACAIGPKAVPVIRTLVRALGSRSTNLIETARRMGTELLSTVGA